MLRWIYIQVKNALQKIAQKVFTIFFAVGNGDEGLDSGRPC
jgi:hypothetical protein